MSKQFSGLTTIELLLAIALSSLVTYFFCDSAAQYSELSHNARYVDPNTGKLEWYDHVNSQLLCLPNKISF